nr:glycosyltransferase family 2 protein [Desulfatiglans anilini]
MLDIIIVNWNAGKQLRNCVLSVQKFASGSVGRIIIVDNGSTDGSLDEVESLAGVDFIRTGKNLGFAAACNIGTAKSSSPYVLFLNPDSRVYAKSLSVPLQFLERAENAKVGICGIQLVGQSGKVSRTCARFPTFGRLIVSSLGLSRLPTFLGSGIHMNDWDHAHTRRVDHVIGAFYMIRQEVLRACDGFDERFFMYFEDLDLSRRARLAGWDSWYLTEAQAFHAGGGTSRQVKTDRLFYSLRSRLLYALKHFSMFQAWFLIVITATVEPFTRTFYCLALLDIAGVRNTWSAFKMLWQGMRRIITANAPFHS